MFTVFYRTSNYNPFRSYPQNANRKAASKVFNTIDEAKAFAMTVNTTCIIDCCGNKVK